jgi:TPP-dependent indolepyruvate ferredoxin oxidoreductase alpha subunit
MGASISGAIGFAKAFETSWQEIFAVLGDSDLHHSGITGLNGCGLQ